MFIGPFLKNHIIFEKNEETIFFEKKGNISLFLEHKTEKMSNIHYATMKKTPEF
jgi:hypothetical protein